MPKKKISETEIKENEEVAPLVIEEAPQKSKLALTRKSLGYLLVLFIIILCFVGMAYFYTKYQAEINKASKSLTNSQNQDQALVAQVAKIAELPANETPTIATVSDVSKLSGQTFFANAQNGDRVLIYNNAKKAYLYRPSTNKIVNIGPVSTNNTATLTPAPSGEEQASSSAEVKKLPGVVILNGTSTVGLTKLADSKLTKDKVGVDVLDRSNARLNTYQETIVVDITGQHKDLISSIIKSVGGKQGALPKGEISPKGADILIILGSDFSL